MRNIKHPRNSRTDQIVVDGKKFYINCSCGSPKTTLRSAYCSNCEWEKRLLRDKSKRDVPIVVINGKRYYTHCPACKGEKQNIKSHYCRKCSNEKYLKKRADSPEKYLSKTGKTYQLTTLERIENKKILLEFVERIESRGGICSMQELFVELITIYSHWSEGTVYETQEPKDQLINMWKTIKRIRDSIVRGEEVKYKYQ